MNSASYAGRIRARSCALVVENSKILLVQQRVPTRETPVWLPPGGEILLGESSRDAATRETAEETGLIVEPQGLAAVHEFLEPPFHAVELYFFAEVMGGDLITGIDPELGDDDQQILNVEFIPLKSLNSNVLYPLFLRELDLLKLRETADEAPRIFSSHPENPS